MSPTRSIAIAAALLSGCSAGDTSEDCALGNARLAVQAEDRGILGAGAPYTPNSMLRGQERELHSSQILRRQAAWQTIAKVLAPVALAQDLPNVPSSEIPLWQTWYAKDDTTRIFQHLYEGLASGEKASHARFDETDIDEAFGWNATEIEELANWPSERREAYLDAVDTSDKLAGLGGIALVGYSPSALRHLLRGYPELLSCLASGAPEAFLDTPGQSIQQAVREPVTLPGCASRQFGPFYVGAGESLQVELSGEGREEASIAIFGMGEGKRVQCDGVAACSLALEGAVYVEVTAGIDAFTGAVQVDYATPEAPWAGCLDGVFSTDSVIIKAGWSRAQFGQKLPVYDTSSDAIGTTLSANAVAGWGAPTGEADPGPSEIYTIERPNGNRYRLTSFHIMTKELDHWQWITLWWSDTPDSDFGEDRPALIEDLGGAWSNYKMCTATAFDEGDPDPSGGYSEMAPSLAAALEQVHEGVGGPSWCSNPYLEKGPGNMATNCIGCHQHGGVDVLSEDIIGDAEAFPHFGRMRQRNNFPHDYSWAPASGDNLTLAFKAVVDFFE
ncbi:MAG: hypothetical protein GY811_01110 [Myxococcales bacterium]|nr:hypothetical protein [Myxococcales bacterium]